MEVDDVGYHQSGNCHLTIEDNKESDGDKCAKKDSQVRGKCDFKG